MHLIPSGILHPGTKCFLGNGMVISPEAFLEELDGLLAKGVDADGRLFISDRAQLLVPVHGHLDQARESAAGKDKIGTTARGIGPTYEMKISRYGLRIGDLRGDLLGKRLRSQIARIESELRHIGVDADTAYDETMALLGHAAERLDPYITDVSLALSQAIAAGESVLFEGAQGTLLDIDHGTYPYVTSSNSTAGGACTGTGVPPTAITGVLGILKAYTTRVGEGPFPDRAARRVRPAPGAGGQRVRHHHGQAAPLWLARSGDRPLRRPHQRPRLDRADQARRARRARADSGVRRLRDRR